jgi:predicted DNA-binding antitoxin AbrB/MazE fold protein
MSTVHAIYSQGVFHPTANVDLPENVEVEFEPRVVAPAGDDDDQASLHGILGRRFHSGEHDVAQRHSEHQP